ncbi:hypothetical protein BSKO_09253 [Bryopsis sp. KO-2023]|nr:hypothetical protein BSKO_09253 [Bryopsis sp. KO-2023]
MKGAISAESRGQKLGGFFNVCQIPRLQANPPAERRPHFRVHADAHSNSPIDRRNILLSLTASIGAFAALTPDATAASFLKEKGGKGVLADREDELYQLRVEKETAAKEDLEKEVRETQLGKFCATPFGVDVVGITEVVALIGALVGGVAARQRKMEVEKLNESLRKINMSLRQQARAGIVYAPGLRYAPPADADQEDTTATIPPPQPSAFQGGDSPLEVGQQPAQPIPIALASLDDEYMTADQKQCRDALRTGKSFLKDKNGAAAMVRFEKALMLSKGMQDFIQERRAMRGLAASARLQGQFRMAISHLERVLEISSEINDHIGDADAFGTIADVYTEMGEFEKAAEFYDKYIAQMNQDGPV